MARGTARWNRLASAMASKSGRGSSRAASISSALDRMRGASFRAASRGDKVTSILAICGQPGHGAWRRSCQRARMRSTLRSPSKEVLPKAKGLPQNRCYHRHRKGGPVTERGRREYAEVMRQRYQRATKQQRSALLDEYCRVTRCHRKAAIRRLGAAPVGRGRAPGRPARYGRDLLPVLERVWVASDQFSGKLLRPILHALVTALERHHGVVLVPAVRAALLAASPATLDRLLRPLRRRRPRQPRRLAPAVGSLRAQVPLRTWSEWTGVQPGALQRRSRLALRGVRRRPVLCHTRRRRRRHHLDRTAGAVGSTSPAGHGRHPACCDPPALSCPCLAQ